MSKQLVNLIGAVASAAIILLGVVVFALPLFSSAGATAAAADDVAAQNRTQQTVLDALTAQAADMAALRAEVDELRAEIPEAAHLDDILLLAVDAADDNGGVLTSLIPAATEPFAPRTEAGAATAPTADGTAEATPEPATADASAGAAAAGNAAATAPPAHAPEQVPVTVVIEAGDVAAATRALDALRAGPRLVAVTKATVTARPEGGATLTATLLTFHRP